MRASNSTTVWGTVENVVIAPEGHIFFHIMEEGGNRWHCRGSAGVADLIRDLTTAAVFTGSFDQKKRENADGSSRTSIFFRVDRVSVPVLDRIA